MLLVKTTPSAAGAGAGRPGPLRRGRAVFSVAITPWGGPGGASCSKADQSTNNGDATTTAPKANSVGGMVQGPPDGPSIAGGKIKYGIDAEPEGLDPMHFAFSQAGHVVASAVFEPLATLDDKGNAI